MTLREKQSRFALEVARLIVHANAVGYQITLDEAYRPPELAALYAQQGRGITNSLHTIKLAVDLNFFLNGALCTAEQIRPVGVWWEQQHALAHWGGRFKDARHFSWEHNGRK